MHNQFDQRTASDKNEELLVKLLTHTGFVDDNKSAHRVFTVITIICFVIAGIIVYRTTQTVPFSVNQEDIEAALTYTGQ